MDHPGLNDGLVAGFVGGVTFLPEEFGGAQKQPGTHLPTHHVRPLVDQQRQVAVRFNPARKGRPDDRLRGRPDDVGLGEFARGNELGLACERILARLKTVMGDHRTFRRKPLGVLGFLFQIRERDEQRKIGVLVAGGLEAAVELLLDELPNSVAPWLDDHAATGFRIFGEVGCLDDLLIPFREVLGAGRGDGGLF